MARQPGMSVAAGLWGVAFIALGLASATTTANERGVFGIAGVGHVLTMLALVIDRAGRTQPLPLAGRGTTLLIFGTILVLELVGTVVSLAFGETSLATWFGLGASFSTVGLVLNRDRVPNDDVLACQLFFHATLLAPLLASLPLFLLGLDDASDPLSMGRAMVRLVILVLCVVAIPLLLVALATVVAYNLSKPETERDGPWAVMTANQAVFVIVVVRWAANGL